MDERSTQESPRVLRREAFGRAQHMCTESFVSKIEDVNSRRC